MKHEILGIQVNNLPSDFPSLVDISQFIVLKACINQGLKKPIMSVFFVTHLSLTHSRWPNTGEHFPDITDMLKNI